MGELYEHEEKELGERPGFRTLPLYPGCVTKWWCFWISHVLDLASSSLHLEIRLGHGSNTKGQVGYKPPKSRSPTFPVIRNDVTVKSFPGAFHIQVETLWGCWKSFTCPTLPHYSGDTYECAQRMGSLPRIHLPISMKTSLYTLSPLWVHEILLMCTKSSLSALSPSLSHSVFTICLPHTYLNLVNLADKTTPLT